MKNKSETKKNQDKNQDKNQEKDQSILGLVKPKMTKNIEEQVQELEKQMGEVKSLHHLSKTEMKQIRHRLLEETVRLQELENADVDMQMNYEGNSDEADMASLDYSQSQILRIKNRGSSYSKKLQRAFQKIESGEFGLCEECASPIKFARLSARPTADLCIDCKEEAERDELTWASPSAAHGSVQLSHPTL